MRHIDGRMAVERDIISAWEEFFKRDEIKVRPVARIPSVPVGSAIMPKAREESWACLVPLPLLSVTKAVWHILTGDHAGEKVALLAQLKLPLATSSNYIPPDKRILLPAPHALPCAPDGGTDVPCSQYTACDEFWIKLVSYK